jgi:putative endonuclease
MGMTHVVYIARGPRGALRIGRSEVVPGRSRPRGVHRLVYVEAFSSVGEAISRERQIKAWDRQWQVDLVERANPAWRDLAAAVCG